MCNVIVDALNATAFVPDGEQYLRANVNETITGAWTFQNNSTFGSDFTIQNPNKIVTISGGGGVFSVQKETNFTNTFISNFILFLCR